MKNVSFDSASPFHYKDETLVSVSFEDREKSSLDWDSVGDSFTQVYSVNELNSQIKYKVVRCETNRSFCKTALFGTISMKEGVSGTTNIEWQTSLTKEAYSGEISTF